MRRSIRLTQKPRIDYSQMVRADQPLRMARRGSESSGANQAASKRSSCDYLLLLNVALLCAFAFSSYAAFEENKIQLHKMFMSNYMLSI